MENTSLTPYRAGPPVVQPIDESLVPDCGRREIAGLKDKLNQLNQECCEVGVARGEQVFWRWWLRLNFTTLLIVPIAAIAHKSFFFILLYCTITIIVFSLSSSIVAEGVRDKTIEIEKRSKLLQMASVRSRLSTLESLEQLTGKGEHAIKLLSEVASFNLHLKNLSVADYSVSDRELIATKRAELMGRIHALRSQTLEVPEPSAPPLLSAIND